MRGLNISGISPYRAGYQIMTTETAAGTDNKEREASAFSMEAVFDQSLVGRISKKEVWAPSSADVAEALTKQYPQVHFIFADADGYPENLAEFAAGAGEGIHLVVSSEVLDWMTQGSEAWRQGAEMIGQAVCRMMKDMQPGVYNTGAVIGDNGEITYWSAQLAEEDVKQEWEQELDNIRNMLDRFEESRKRNAERMKKLRLSQKKKINYQMGRDMSRLARGTTDKEVRSLISRVYAARGRVAGSRAYDKKEIQSAVAQMDHVIRCARTKIRQLKEEEQINLRRKKAEKQKQEKLRRELERELKERRRARKAKEHARIFERLPDLPGLRDEEDRREAQEEAMAAAAASGMELPGTTAVTAGETGGTGAAAEGAGSEAAGAAVSVTVSTVS